MLFNQDLVNLKCIMTGNEEKKEKKSTPGGTRTHNL